MEAIRRCALSDPAHRLLVCTHTNMAADLLLSKLVSSFEPKHVLRLYKAEQSKSSIGS